MEGCGVEGAAAGLRRAGCLQKGGRRSGGRAHLGTAVQVRVLGRSHHRCSHRPCLKCDSRAADWRHPHRCIEQGQDRAA